MDVKLDSGISERSVDEVAKGDGPIAGLDRQLIDAEGQHLFSRRRPGGQIRNYQLGRPEEAILRDGNVVSPLAMEVAAKLQQVSAIASDDDVAVKVHSQPVAPWIEVVVHGRFDEGIVHPPRWRKRVADVSAREATAAQTV